MNMRRIGGKAGLAPLICRSRHEVCPASGSVVVVRRVCAVARRQGGILFRRTSGRKAWSSPGPAQVTSPADSGSGGDVGAGSAVSAGSSGSCMPTRGGCTWQGETCTRCLA